MAHIIFWEKPGCAGNARQRALLVSSGHTLEVRNLLTEPWTAEKLRPFFGDRPLAEWFNTSSPRVKSGQIDPERLTEGEALQKMIADPLLIRRPLMQVGEARRCGFDEEVVNGWIGLTRSAIAVTDSCVRERG